MKKGGSLLRQRNSVRYEFIQEEKKVFLNLLKREFTVLEPNKVWVSDITYIRTSAEWLYLAVIIDLFNKEVVGWAMGKKIDRHLVMNALEGILIREI